MCFKLNFVRFEAALEMCDRQIYNVGNTGYANLAIQQIMRGQAE